MSTKKSFDTVRASPSHLHWRLMRETIPQLAYDGGDVKTWQGRLRRKVKDLLGWPQMPSERRDLNVRSLWKREHEHGTIEKIVLTMEPGSDANAYLCVPRDAGPAYDWFICLQGHSTGAHNSVALDFETNTRPIEVEGDRDFGVGCMRRGIAAICLEQRGFGERGETAMKSRSSRSCHEAAMHALMLGRTLIGERVYDVDRAIDYLRTRDDVNPTRIGVMGNSGGGTVSLFAAAVLPRIAWAMPSCYFCSFADSIMAMHHCQCNYVPHILRYAGMADLMGLFAPNPVVIVSGRKDDIFPIGPARKEFRRLAEIYRAAGAPANCRHVIGDGGHRFYAEQGWNAMLRCMNRDLP